MIDPDENEWFPLWVTGPVLAIVAIVGMLGTVWLFTELWRLLP